MLAWNNIDCPLIKYRSSIWIQWTSQQRLLPVTYPNREYRRYVPQMNTNNSQAPFTLQGKRPSCPLGGGTHSYRQHTGGIQVNSPPSTVFHCKYNCREAQIRCTSSQYFLPSNLDFFPNRLNTLHVYIASFCYRGSGYVIWVMFT